MVGYLNKIGFSFEMRSTGRLSSSKVLFFSDMMDTMTHIFLRNFLKFLLINPPGEGKESGSEILLRVDILQKDLTIGLPMNHQYLLFFCLEFPYFFIRF